MKKPPVVARMQTTRRLRHDAAPADVPPSGKAGARPQPVRDATLRMYQTSRHLALLRIVLPTAKEEGNR